MQLKHLSIVTLLSAFVAIPQTMASAAVVTGGSASWTLTEGVAASIFEFDAYFNEATSRANVLGLAAPGNGAFTEGMTVQFLDPIRPSGASLITGDGRTRQNSSLDLENLADILGSWATTTDFGPFVGSASSEQIAFTSIQRYTGPFTGALVYGDFALRNVAGRRNAVREGNTLSGLVLTSNIDFANAAFADIGNATINVSGSQLLISGDLLISDGLGALDPFATLGQKFGTFAMTAELSTTAVPEPSSIALLGFSAVGLLVAKRRRKRAIVA